MNIVLYAHGGSKNHGCEAIVRATAQELKKIDDYPILLSYNIQEDKIYGLNKLMEVRQELNEINKKSLSFFYAYFKQRVFRNYNLMDSLMHREAIKELSDVDIALFIGGDNYCYSNAKNYTIINSFMRKKAKKTILWGTSVEPDVLKDKIIRKDIQRFDYIVARESISYEALKGVNKNTALFPDPAFCLLCEETELPVGFQKNNTIGINISPLIIEKEKEKGCVLQNYENLIKYIIEYTDYQIALIPHVVWESNDDRKPMEYLYEKYKETNKVVLVSDHNCMQQKYIISKCEMFIGARTHATIAAYSECVPTLVVGYSVKARGIARDLFGTEEGYVLPVQELTENGQLTKAFIQLSSRSDEIKCLLKNKIPQYKVKAQKAADVIQKINNSI